MRIREWGKGDDWNNRVNHLHVSLKMWNKRTFGNVFYGKRKILKRLQGIKKKVSLGDNHILRLLKELKIIKQDVYEEFRLTNCFLELSDQPTSLCNLSYKVIMKVLALRLRNIMDGLIGSNQCSFVPSYHNKYNIMIKQEVIHSMCNKSGKKWMVLKIDLEKAYNHLSLSFIFIQNSLIKI
uniref:Retrovirus-related Pol polyprotein LINE-1 n=1 Tax=Cajanus cajan TaxID=3821 RepID=A0A151T605_CAJCA|nr:Retrovirus-related Pol polyprotein LINE-1 [Cajanus cajan]